MSIHLPTVNASLNAMAFFFLCLGFHSIKRGDRVLHKIFMISALLASILFLCSYITYHYMIQGAVTHYHREGLLKVLYLTILISHTPLAAIVPGLAIAAVYHAIKENFRTHVRITKILFPIWIYVSVTGVIIYLMLYIF